MKKQVALALAAAFSLSVAGTALAAPANPFVDVPANHWAYSALTQLQKDGVVGGYGDNTFRGDRTLTRYEMATIVAKITGAGEGKNSSLVKKLQSEFSTELYNLGVRVDKLEKNASTIKFTGDARIRYQQGMAIGGADAAKDSAKDNSAHMQERVRLQMQANVTDNVNFYGTITAQNKSNKYESTGYKSSETAKLTYDRAEFNWTNKNLSLSAGRLVPTLGQGLIWDGSSADGFTASYNSGKFSLMGGIVDLEANNGLGATTNATIANLGYAINDKINVSAAYLGAMNPQDVTKASENNLHPGYHFKQLAFGANAKLGKDFTLIGEYVKNSDAPANGQNKGGWAKLKWREIDTNKPGSFSASVEYMKLGNWAIDSEGFGHGLVVAGGNGIGRDGAKGYGLGLQYVLAKNVSMDFNVYDLKTMSGAEKYKKAYNFATNFSF